MHTNKIALYPGSFDPITRGHIDIIERSSAVFDKVIVVVSINTNKQTLFNENERTEMIKESIKNLSNIEVIINKGQLTVDVATKLGASTIIRGIRAISDFDFEFQIALTNRKLAPGVDTIFMLPDEKYTFVSSTIIREVAMFGGDVSCFVNEFVEAKLKFKFGPDKNTCGKIEFV